MLAGYVLGATLGATVGWNISKRSKTELAAIQPIDRAGPSPAQAASWIEPLEKLSSRDPGNSRALAVRIVAFAF
jgi:hypothetical protein